MPEIARHRRRRDVLLHIHRMLHDQVIGQAADPESDTLATVIAKRAEPVAVLLACALVVLNLRDAELELPVNVLLGRIAVELEDTTPPSADANRVAA